MATAQQPAKKKIRNKESEVLPESFSRLTAKDTSNIVTEEITLDHSKYEEYQFMKGKTYPKAVSIEIPNSDGDGAGEKEIIGTLSTQKTRNAELVEIKMLQDMLRNRQSPIPEQTKLKVEKRIKALYDKLFPDTNEEKDANEEEEDSD